MNTLEIYNALRKHIPAELAADWDNEGVMLLTEPEREITRALVTLDITPGAVDAAAARSCGLIVSHHPVIFRPLKRFDSPKLAALVHAGISALSFHTSLDCADGGTADTLAALLRLTKLEKLYDDGVPCGRVGVLPAPIGFGALRDAVRYAVSAQTIEAVAVRGAGDYHRIAVCPGEGKSMYKTALESGADAYICGAMPYNDLCDASEQNMTVITAGHFETEQPVCGVLETYLRELGIECEFYTSNPVEKS